MHVQRCCFLSLLKPIVLCHSCCSHGCSSCFAENGKEIYQKAKVNLFSFVHCVAVANTQGEGEAHVSCSLGEGDGENQGVPD